MMRTAVALVGVLVCVAISEGYRPLRPQIKRSFPRADSREVGEPLFLTPFIQNGDIEAGRELAKVDSSLLQGLNDAVESYSGFLTVDAPNNGNMFFWFFPAAVRNQHFYCERSRYCACLLTKMIVRSDT